MYQTWVFLKRIVDLSPLYGQVVINPEPRRTLRATLRQICVEHLLGVKKREGTPYYMNPRVQAATDKSERKKRLSKETVSGLK
jgi:hypothetical protein